MGIDVCIFARKIPTFFTVIFNFGYEWENPQMQQKIIATRKKKQK